MGGSAVTAMGGFVTTACGVSVFLHKRYFRKEHIVDVKWSPPPLQGRALQVRLKSRFF